MLKVPSPSPPVPQVSTTGSEILTRRAFVRIVLASPAISSTVSPFSRKAVTKAPNWAGVALPSMISSITVEASSIVSECLLTSCAMASFIILVNSIKEITQDLFPVLCHKRLRVELNTLERVLFMP